MDSIPLELWNGMSGIMRALGWKRGWFGWIGVCVGNRVCVCVWVSVCVSFEPHIPSFVGRVTSECRNMKHDLEDFLLQWRSAC